jgi:addiction module HigA family antidote
MEKKQPQNPFHPGEMLLEEFLEPAGIKQSQFAQKVGWTRTRVNEFIKGKRGGLRVRSCTATIRLSRVL